MMIQDKIKAIEEWLKDVKSDTNGETWDEIAAEGQEHIAVLLSLLAVTRDRADRAERANESGTRWLDSTEKLLLSYFDKLCDEVGTSSPAWPYLSRARDVVGAVFSELERPEKA